MTGDLEPDDDWKPLPEGASWRDEVVYRVGLPPAHMREPWPDSADVIAGLKRRRAAANAYRHLVRLRPEIRKRMLVLTIRCTRRKCKVGEVYRVHEGHLFVPMNAAMDYTTDPREKMVGYIPVRAEPDLLEGNETPLAAFIACRCSRMHRRGPLPPALRDAMSQGLRRIDLSMPGVMELAGPSRPYGPDDLPPVEWRPSRL